MSFFSFLKRNKESYSLVFNIGSGSVSGGIIRFTEKAGVDIVHYAKETIPFQQDISSEKHLSLMKTSLAKLTHSLHSGGFKKIIRKKGEKFLIDKVFFLFSSLWSTSQNKKIIIKETKEFKITDNYLKHIIETQEKSFQSDISRFGKIIEKKIIQMKVNGYTVDSSHGRSTKNLELSVFFTVVPQEILNTVETAVSKVFYIKNVWCHSLSLAVFTNIRNLFPHKEDFIHVDVSEEMTDLSIIKDNIIINSVSIPFGRNHFIRELSNVTKVSEEVADSMIRMHGAGDNNQLAALRLAISMDVAAKKWLSQVSAVIDKLKESIYIPEVLFLIADNDMAVFLKDILQKKDFEVNLIDNKKIKTSLVGDDKMFKLGLMFLDNIYKI